MKGVLKRFICFACYCAVWIWTQDVMWERCLQSVWETPDIFLCSSWEWHLHLNGAVPYTTVKRGEQRRCLFLFRYHRMALVGTDLKDHVVPTSLPWAGTLSSRPGSSKSHLTWPWMGHPSFSGKCVPVPLYPHREDFLPNIQSNPTLHQPEAIFPYPVLPGTCK